MAEKYFGGIIDIPAGDATELNPFARECDEAIAPITYSDGIFHNHWSNLQFSVILEHIWRVVSVANNHIAQTEPWKLAKSDTEQLKKVMFNIWNALRLVALSIYPFMPETSEKIWKQIGLKSLTEEAKQSLSPANKYPEIYYWDWKPSYSIKVSKGEHLFPRIETKDSRKK